MAIFWCDPYIESPSGGVDGTTGVGALGSYSNPYSIDSMPNNVYNNGDEIRLKALPANAWITGPVWLSNTGGFTSWSNGQYGVYWEAAPDAQSFLKYTTTKGDEQYLNWNKPDQRHARASPAFWETPVPYGDITKPAYKLDPQYYLSNLVNPSQGYMLQGQYYVETTLTAGWVSETARGGETIIHRTNPTAAVERWFGQGAQHKMTVDAPELTISQSANVNGRILYIYGETVELRDVNMRNTYSTSHYLYIHTTGTFKANCISCGGYIKINSPNSAGPEYPLIVGEPNREINHILGGYQLEFYQQGEHSRTTHATHLKFKTFLIYLLKQNVDSKFSYYDNFYFKMLNRQGNTAPTEMAIDPAVNADPAPAFQHAGPSSLAALYGYDYSTYNTRTHKLPIYTYGKYLTGGARVDIARSSSYFKELRLPPGATLENTTSHGVISSVASDSAYSWGRFWGVDRNSGRRIAFAPSGSYNRELMMMYNSTEYGGKLVYHLMPHEARSFDRVYIDMPTGLNQIPNDTDFRLKYTLGGAVQGKVDLFAYIEGNSTTDDWTRSNSEWISVDASAGGDDAVIYAPLQNFQYYIEGSQQLTVVLAFKNTNSADIANGQCAKICIKSIELEVV